LIAPLNEEAAEAKLIQLKLRYELASQRIEQLEEKISACRLVVPDGAQGVIYFKRDVEDLPTLPTKKTCSLLDPLSLKVKRYLLFLTRRGKRQLLPCQLKKPPRYRLPCRQKLSFRTDRTGESSRQYLCNTWEHLRVAKALSAAVKLGSSTHFQFSAWFES